MVEAGSNVWSLGNTYGTALASAPRVVRNPPFDSDNTKNAPHEDAEDAEVHKKEFAKIIGHRFWSCLLQQQETPLLQQVTSRAKKLILITKKVEIFQRVIGFSLKCNGTITSWVVAVHTSSGSTCPGFGYRHTNFLTASGSVYYGSFLEYTDASEDIHTLLVW